MDIPVGKELDTAIALAFPELGARFVKGARCGETTVREGPSMSLEMCRTACERAELWAGVPFEPVAVLPFSRNISDAWQVVEIIQKRFNELITVNRYSENNTWEASFYLPFGYSSPVEAEGDTAPEAICRAALKVHAAVSKP